MFFVKLQLLPAQSSASYRGLPFVTSWQLVICFKNYELFDEGGEREKQIKLPLDRAALIEARKITNQHFFDQAVCNRGIPSVGEY